VDHLGEAIDYVENVANQVYEALGEQQLNLLSNLVGGLGAAALHKVSPYHRDPDPNIAQTRFPDLKNDQGVPLECKGNFAFNPPNAHNQEEGCFIIWRYVIDKDKNLDKNRVLKVFRVDIGYLLLHDWKIMPRGPTSKRTPNSAPTIEGMQKLRPVYRDPRVQRKAGGFEIANVLNIGS
jgi:hypothetical protein